MHTCVSLGIVYGGAITDHQQQGWKDTNTLNMAGHQARVEGCGKGHYIAVKNLVVKRQQARGHSRGLVINRQMQDTVLKWTPQVTK